MTEQKLRTEADFRLWWAQNAHRFELIRTAARNSIRERRTLWAYLVPIPVNRRCPLEVWFNISAGHVGRVAPYIESQAMQRIMQAADDTLWFHQTPSERALRTFMLEYMR